LQDPHGELASVEKKQVAWLLGDSHVAFISPAKSAFGCPLLSVFSAASGVVLCRSGVQGCRGLGCRV